MEGRCECCGIELDENYSVSEVLVRSNSSRSVRSFYCETCLSDFYRKNLEDW
ncbi:hypothetical protein KGY73_10640 [bacterium]|nr:hypothetical protein [bacterium]